MNQNGVPIDPIMDLGVDRSSWIKYNFDIVEVLFFQIFLFSVVHVVSVLLLLAFLAIWIEMHFGGWRNYCLDLTATSVVDYTS